MMSRAPRPRPAAVAHTLMLPAAIAIVFVFVASASSFTAADAFVPNPLPRVFGGGRALSRRPDDRTIPQHRSSSSSTSGQPGLDDDGGPLWPIRYLGKGSNAIVRPGCVLVAPSHEASHFLMKSAVFVHAVGEDEASGDTLIRGVVLDHPTAFTMGEMAAGTVHGTLAGNILFRGGDIGGDTAMLLHSVGGEGGQVECGEMIGTSGVYEGGLQSAMDAAEDGLVDPGQFKFFFNFIEFTETELEKILGEVDSEGDAWISVEVPKEMVLEGDFNRWEAWKYIRNQIRQMEIE